MVPCMSFGWPRTIRTSAGGHTSAHTWNDAAIRHNLGALIRADEEALGAWLAALEARHLADLRVPEVTRALRALSAAYVERRRNRPTERGGRTRDESPVRGTLDSAGKRAAFALFYAPLHFMTVAHVVRALSAPAPSRIVDLGCGTGAAGAAWAVEAGRTPSILGLERHPWAVSEARWNYRQLGLRGDVQQSDVTRGMRLRHGDAAVAGWVLNELSHEGRTRVERSLFELREPRVQVLVLEPIARSVTPWWEATAARVVSAGGRADEWRFQVDLPPLLRMFDKAAGLDHRELTARTLYMT